MTYGTTTYQERSVLSLCLYVSLSVSAPPPQLPAGPPRWLQASQLASKGLQGPLSWLQGPLSWLQGPLSWHQGPPSRP